LPEKPTADRPYDKLIIINYNKKEQRYTKDSGDKY